MSRSDFNTILVYTIDICLWFVVVLMLVQYWEATNHNKKVRAAARDLVAELAIQLHKESKLDYIPEKDSALDYYGSERVPDDERVFTLDDFWGKGRKPISFWGKI